MNGYNKKLLIITLFYFLFSSFMLILGVVLGEIASNHKFELQKKIIETLNTQQCYQLNGYISRKGDLCIVEK